MRVDQNELRLRGPNFSRRSEDAFVMKDPVNLPLALMNASATALASGDQQYCGRVQQVTLSMELVKNV